MTACGAWLWAKPRVNTDSWPNLYLYSTTIPKRSTVTLGHIRVQDQILIIGLPCVMTEAKLLVSNTLNHRKLVYIKVSFI